MKLIAAAVEPFPHNIPIGEIFNLLRKQPHLTDLQREALRLWDAGLSHKSIFVPDNRVEGAIHL